MSTDADPKFILEEIFRTEPWRFGRASVYLQDLRRRPPANRQDDALPKAWETALNIVGVAIVFPTLAIIVGGMASIFFASVTGQEVEDLWFLPRLLANLFPPVFLGCLLLGAGAYLIDNSLYWLNVWRVSDTQLMSARGEAFERISADLRNRFTAASLERARAALEIERGHGSAARAGLESAGAVVAALFAAVEATLGDRGLWVPVAAALLALALAIQARRSRSKAERLRVAALLLGMSVEPSKPIL